MRKNSTGRGFTLSELIASMGVIAVLAAILFPVFAGARDSARLVQCTANLHQIAVAAQVYYQDHHGPPMTPLLASFGSYVDSASVFVCPADHDSLDSYSEFFVGRYCPATATEFVVGCPRHNKGRKSAAICGKAKSEIGLTGELKHNGSKIQAGQLVEGGVLKFADGSRVDIQDGLSIMVLTSVSTDAGLHSVVWIPEGNEGSIDVTVTPGSRFEVCTPEIVAAVRGTRFRVTVYENYQNYGHPASYLVVYEGEVMVEARLQPGEVILGEGESVFVKSTLVAEAPDEDEGYRGPGPWQWDDWDNDWWRDWWENFWEKIKEWWERWFG